MKIEIQRHRNKLLKIAKLTNSELFELEELFTQKIKFIDERLILKSTLIETEAQLKTIDPNDTVFVALTKQLKGKLWTGDMQLYRGLRDKGFNDYSNS